MKLAQQTVEQMPQDKIALLTSERHTMIKLSETMGIPLEELLNRLWSSDVVSYRAAHLIELAQQDLISDESERRSKERQRAQRVAGRRRGR